MFVESILIRARSLSRINMESRYKLAIAHVAAQCTRCSNGKYINSKNGCEVQIQMNAFVHKIIDHSMKCQNNKIDYHIYSWIRPIQIERTDERLV